MKNYNYLKASILFFLLAFGLNQQAQAKLPNFKRLVKKASPAVVNISTVQRVSGSEFHKRFDLPDDVPEIFRHFFGIPTPMPKGNRESTSLGSGFIISSDGYILTNNHVINNASEIIVRLNDRRELEAKVIGADKSSDLALLKVNAKNLPTVETGDSSKLEVGEWVMAIGSPFGFDYSVTAGIVSAKGRSLPNESYVPFIQTDVAINPGNSGGPLFNLAGKVVGINSQIYTRSGGFMGVSFAIPINVALDVAEQLKQDGRVSRGWLGVVIQEVNKELAESFGLKKAAGALIAQVLPNSPAQKAGLKSGDIIVRFNKKDIELSSDLPHQVGRIKPEQTARLIIVRGGKKKMLKVKIGQVPTRDDTELATNYQNQKSQAESNRLGLVVTDIPKKSQSSQTRGVYVKEVKQGPASFAGLIPGDIITILNGSVIRNVQEFKQVVASLPKNRSVPVRILRRGTPMFFPLRLTK